MLETPSPTTGISTLGPMAWWPLAWFSVGLGAVLRVWGIGGQDLTFDEAFTASAAREPVSEVFSFLREHDTHPPLDYLLRKPFAWSGTDLVVRLPSVVFSVVALLLFARWMRTKGEFGAFATMAAALMPFLVGHGRDARMYPLVMLMGVIAAIAADRWLHHPSAGSASIVGGAGLVAMLAHSAAIPAVAAMALLPGFRRDRAAWQYRGAIMASLGAWSLLWLPSLIHQSSAVTDPSYWIPRNSPSWFEAVTAAFLTPRSAMVHLAFLLFLVAVAALMHRQDSVARVAALSLLIPLVVLAFAGLKLQLFIPRSFAFGAWAVAAGLGAAVDWLRSAAGARGAVVGVVIIFALLVPPSVDLVRFGREEIPQLDVLRRRLQPGDEVAIGPAWFAPLLQWNLVAKDGLSEVGERRGRFVVADQTAPSSGRVHLMDQRALPIGAPPPGVPCAPPVLGANWMLRCVERR